MINVTIFNRKGATPFDHDVSAPCGDGDMMEGVTGEAASPAGHLGLSDLRWIHDRDTIGIDGHATPAFTEDMAARRAYGWPEDARFLVPDGVADHLRDAMIGRAGPPREACEAAMARYGIGHPEDAAELDDGPSCIALSRRALPAIDRDKYAPALIAEVEHLS